MCLVAQLPQAIRGPYVTGASFVLTLQVIVSSVITDFRELKRTSLDAAANGITFISNFVKIEQLIQKLEQDMHTAYCFHDSYLRS
jgi:hypothetical protein